MCSRVPTLAKKCNRLLVLRAVLAAALRLRGCALLMRVTITLARPSVTASMLNAYYNICTWTYVRLELTKSPGAEVFSEAVVALQLNTCGALRRTFHSNTV